jgi:hypothetical protein
MAKQPNPGTGPAVEDIRCAEVEPLFAEYLDGTLSATAQARLEAHLATCHACTEALAEVRRGLGWMQLLRADTLPVEPPAGLLEKILARTSNAASTTTTSATGVVTPATRPSPWSSVNLAAVRSGVRRTGLLEPRLALTAAMAFFSISVTLSVAGIRPVDLKPTNIRRTMTRTYFDANARVTRYYENMRAVYQLESRVRELRRAAETSNRPATNTNQPQQQPKPKTTPQSDSTRHPSAVDDGLARKDSKSGQQQKKSDPKDSEPEPLFTGDAVEARLNFPAQRPDSGRTAFSDTTLSPSTEIESLTVVPQRSMA